jgi:hypothetical protein
MGWWDLLGDRLRPRSYRIKSRFALVSSGFPSMSQSMNASGDLQLMKLFETISPHCVQIEHE